VDPASLIPHNIFAMPNVNL